MYINSKLDISQQCSLEAKKASTSTASWWREVVVPLFTALMWPNLEYCVQFWVPQYKNIRLLECVQTRETKIVKGLKGKIYEE